MIRDPVVAGMFYPNDPSKLADMVKSFISGSGMNSEPSITGLVCPHAGYVYSGAVAGAAYASAPDGVRTVILLAPPHRYPVQGASVFDGSGYRTPLGIAEVDNEITGKLLQGGLTFQPAAHEGEHSAEVQIPFIQIRWPGASIVVVLVGSLADGYPARLAGLIHSASEGMENVLIVASSDLSHYHSYIEAVEMDRRVINAFCSGNTSSLREVLSVSGEACGGGPILSLMHYANLSGPGRYGEICYDTSATASGDRSTVVGYFAGYTARG